MQAPNRHQNLRAFFNQFGIEIAARSGNVPNSSKPGLFPHNCNFRWKWQTIGFGRLPILNPITSVEPKPLGNRVVYPREHLIEWYENKPEGIEQGFVIFKKPQILANTHWVAISSQPIENLILKMAANKQQIFFFDQNMVKVLEYSKLLVLDSSGKILPSEFRLKNNQISIAFNDQNAIYPIFIDPLLTNPSWTAEGNQAGAHFGCCVDSAGDVNGDGYSDIIIGAYGYDNGETDEGRVYLFLGSVVGLAASAAWSAEGDQVNARFGSTLAHAGDVNGDGYSDVIIGADLYDNSETNEGQVRLYLGSIFGLNSTPSWTAESNQPDANFGRYLSCAGDVNGDGFSDVIIGAPGYDNGELDEGRIFLYLGNVSGLPPSPSWTFESNQASAFCGPVASAGDVNGDGFCDVLTSAFSYSNSEPGEGKCYAFLGSSSGLNTAPIWSFEGNQNYAYLGQSLSSAGDINGEG